MQREVRFTDMAALLVLAGVTAVMFATTPQNGDFWWSEAPRNALNSVFMRDLIIDFPLRDPVGYAQNYYLKYPALTILFYPPLFYLLSAPFFAIFGVSHVTALIPVMLFYFALGAGAYWLSRRWFERPVALGLALALVGMPEIALWGRQVMLEVPCYAALIWTLVAFFHFLDTKKPSFLYLTVFLLLTTLYIKQTVLFIAPVALIGLLVFHGASALRQRHTWIAAVLFLLGMLPLVFMTLKFGQANLQSVTSIGDAIASRLALDGWVWYAKVLPKQMGWPLLTLALLGIAVMAAQKRWRPPAKDLVLLSAWFLVGYLYYSAIDLKETRHDIFILLPLLVAAFIPLARLLPKSAAGAAAILVGVAMLSQTVATRPVLRVDGYQAAADFIATHAPKDSVVLFSGKRDGAFIFNMRAHEERGDLSTLRSDKLLLKISVERRRGVGQADYSEDEIAGLLNKYGVHYVVAQSDFWTDLEQMARLQNVLRSNRFEEVERIQTVANFNNEDKELRIYRNLGPVAQGPIQLQLDLHIIGRTVGGAIGK